MEPEHEPGTVLVYGKTLVFFCQCPTCKVKSARTLLVKDCRFRLGIKKFANYVKTTTHRECFACQAKGIGDLINE